MKRRYGYRRIHVLLHREGWQVNGKSRGCQDRHSDELFNHCRRDTVAFITTEQHKAPLTPANLPQPHGYPDLPAWPADQDFDVRRAFGAIAFESLKARRSGYRRWGGREIFFAHPNFNPCVSRVWIRPLGPKAAFVKRSYPATAAADSESPDSAAVCGSNRQRSRQPGRLGIEGRRSPSPELSVVRNDQTVCQSAGAVRASKQGLLNGRLILKGQFSSLKQCAEHA